MFILRNWPDIVRAMKVEIDDKDELELLRACRDLGCETDDCLEVALRDRLSLEPAIAAAMQVLFKHVPCDLAWVRTWDESLELRDFTWPADSPILEIEVGPQIGSKQASQPFVVQSDERTVVGQRIDVAGEMIGAAAIRLQGTPQMSVVHRARHLLDVWCEELDNFLAAIAGARKKHQVTLALSDALRNPILEDGISLAIEVLRAEVKFEDLILAYLQENDTDGDSLNYRIIKGGEIVHDSLREELHVDAQTREHLLALVHGNENALPAQFGLADYREDVLINGVREAQVVGRLLIANPVDDFNTFDRDLLERFADFLRQRIVDFNREWKVLSQTFSRRSVIRLLGEEGYRKRRLMPREQNVAVLFCDISGFTRLSEQVLKEPALIGELINTWSAKVVQIIWNSGGVFDKMVGDCVIGLWGPPFYEGSARDDCAQAAQAALSIREYTKRLGDDFPSVADVDHPVGVASGLNYCPLFVGLFGPNDDFTGFSSGMNNTARLQGVAERDEILCSDGFVTALAEPSRFDGERTAQVKNVQHALRFRALLK
jgi:adenylate cyclase